MIKDLIKDGQRALPWQRMQLTVAFLVFILLGLNDGTLGVLLPSMQHQYLVDKSTVSLIFFSSTSGYLVAALNSSLLVRTLGNRVYLLLAVAVLVLSMLALAFLPPFPLFVCLLFPQGFAAASLDSGLNADLALRPKSTILLNYLHAFYGVGALVGPTLVSVLIAHGFAWNYMYLIWVAISCLFALGIFAFFSDQRFTEEYQEMEAHRGTSLMELIRIRFVWLLAVFLFVYVGSEVVLGSWNFSFLTQLRQVPLLFAGWIASGYWLGLTLGRFFLARLAVRIGEHRLIQICIIGIVAAMLLVMTPSPMVDCFGLCLTGFCLGPIYPTVMALVSRYLPLRSVASAIGFIISIACAGGAFFPWLAGNLAQYVGLLSLMPFVVFLALLMAGLWMLVPRLARPQRGGLKR